MTQQPGHPGPADDSEDQASDQWQEQTPENTSDQPDQFPPGHVPGAQDPVPEPPAAPGSGYSAASAPETGQPVYDQQQPGYGYSQTAETQGHPGHTSGPGAYDPHQQGYDQSGFGQQNPYGQPGYEGQPAYEQAQPGYYGQQAAAGGDPQGGYAQSAASAPAAYGYGQQQDPYGQQGSPYSQGPGPGYGQPYGGQPYEQQYEQQYQQQYGHHPQGVPPAPAGSRSAEGAGFFAALFDFNFHSFITVKFAKFIYILLIVFLAASWLFTIIAGFISDPLAGLLALLLGWIPAIIYLILIRIMLEFFIAAVRTSQHTESTRAEIEGLRQDIELRD